MRDDLLELRQILSKVIQHFLTLCRVGQCHMLLDHGFQLQHIIFGCDLAGRYHFLIQTLIQIVAFIQYIRDASAHTGCKVFTGGTQDYHTSAGHVFTTVITHTFDYRNGTGVTYAETFACHTVDECFTGGCTVQCHITDDNIFFSLELAALWGIYHQLTAG